MASLREVIESEEIALLDGCIKGDGKGLCKQMYYAKDFSQISSSYVKFLIYEMRELLTLLSLPNAWTIKEVADEIMELERIISQKISYISKFDIKKARELGARRCNAGISVQEKMYDLQEIIFKTYRTAKQKDVLSDKDFGIDITKLNLLHEMLCCLGSALPLKPKKVYVYQDKAIERNSEDDRNRTDEKLIATAFYLSMYCNKKSSIISSDSDFMRMIPLSIGMLSTNDFSPYNEAFKSAMQNYPFKFYFCDRETRDCVLRLQSNLIIFNKQFEIRHDSAKTETTKAKILEFLKSLCS